MSVVDDPTSHLGDVRPLLGHVVVDKVRIDSQQTMTRRHVWALDERFVTAVGAPHHGERCGRFEALALYAEDRFTGVNYRWLRIRRVI
ncbi:MAG: hypothetical protein AAGF11_05065 [Myxococcota bacterium]